MSNALTITAHTALTVTTVSSVDVVFIKSARTNAELLERITEASASVADVGRYLRANAKTLDAHALRVVSYALARARYRENFALTIEQVAILTRMSVAKVRKYYKRLQIQIGEMIANNQVSALMTAVADYD